MPATRRPSASRTRIARSCSSSTRAAALAAAATRSSSSARSAGSGDASTARRYGPSTGRPDAPRELGRGQHLLEQRGVVEVIAER